MGTFIAIIVLGMIFTIWFNTMRAREQAVQIARQACKEMEFSLFNDSVSISAIRPRRDKLGRLKLLRSYEFEIVDQEHQRHPGVIILLGDRLESLLLDTSPHSSP